MSGDLSSVVTAAAVAGRAGTEAASTGGGGPPDVFTRLHDKRFYTGTYRKRFELACHDLTESVVHDLSNTMRTNLKYDVDPRTKRSSYVSSSGPALRLYFLDRLAKV